MTTVHLIYPHGSRISCPDAIGRHVANRLRNYYDIRLYDWDSPGVIEPGGDDVLLGHPHPIPWTIFRRSLVRQGWRRTIAMLPYSHGYIGHMAWVDRMMVRCDQLLAITGDYWFDSVRSSPFSHWLNRMTQLDLAVDTNDFPRIKRKFNPIGKRRFVYIGSTIPSKNTHYLSELAERLPTTRFSWIGNGSRPIRGLDALGYRDFSCPSAKELIAEHDFLITVGSSDANPTTILEAMAWGLVPICTPQSGYVRYPGIVNIPLDAPEVAAEVLHSLQSAASDDLESLRKQNDSALKSHFTWDRVAAQVIEAVEATGRAPLGERSLQNRIILRHASLISNHSWLRPSNLGRYVRGRRLTISPSD